MGSEMCIRDRESNENVSSELSSKDLREEVDVGHESSLENNWNVRGVEQLDRVRLLEASHLSAGQAELNSESLLTINNLR